MRNLPKLAQIHQQPYYSISSCRSYSNHIIAGAEAKIGRRSSILSKSYDSPLPHGTTRVLRSEMVAQLSIFSDQVRSATTQVKPSPQVRQMGAAQVAMISPGIVYEPYAPREPISFLRRWFTKSGWKRTKEDIILELKNAYAVAKLRKTGYSKKVFYTEAFYLYKEQHEKQFQPFGICHRLFCFIMRTLAAQAVKPVTLGSPVQRRQIQNQRGSRIDQVSRFSVTGRDVGSMEGGEEGERLISIDIEDECCALLDARVDVPCSWHDGNKRTDESNVRLKAPRKMVSINDIPEIICYTSKKRRKINDERNNGEIRPLRSILKGGLKYVEDLTSRHQ